MPQRAVAGYMPDTPDDWLALSAYQRDILLVVAINEPITFPDLWSAVGGVTGRTSENYCQQVVGRLRGEGLLERETMGYQSLDSAATYCLTDAGRERVESMQALLWDVATA